MSKIFHFSHYNYCVKLDKFVQRYQIQSLYPQVLLINHKRAKASNVPLCSTDNECKIM